MLFLWGGLISCNPIAENRGGQESGPAPQGSEEFTFTFEDVTSTGVTVTVLPENLEEYFTWNVLSRKDYEENFKNDQELIESWLKNLEDELDNYCQENGEGSWFDVLNAPGNSKLRFNTLDPGVEYIVFAFGVKTDGQKVEVTTGVVSDTFSTNEFNVTDPCEFAIDLIEVLQAEFTFTVTPTSSSTRYYVGFCDASMLDEATPEELSLEFIRRADIAGIDWSASTSLRTGTATLNTIDDWGINDLEPNVSYAVVVFGVNDLGERTTVVCHHVVTTAQIPVSDMTFDIKVLEELNGGVRICFTPSNNDETYYAGAILKENYSPYIGRDEEFMEYIHTTAGLGLQKGEYLFERPEGALIVDRDYIYFAFGFMGGPTTGLTTGTFHSKSPEASKAAVDMVFTQESTADGKISIIASITPNAAAAHWWVQPWKSTDGETIGSIFVTLDDAALLNDLINNKPNPNATKVSGAVFPGEYVAFCAVATDADGTYGDMIKIFVKAGE